MATAKKSSAKKAAKKTATKKVAAKKAPAKKVAAKKAPAKKVAAKKVAAKKAASKKAASKTAKKTVRKAPAKKVAAKKVAAKKAPAKKIAAKKAPAKKIAAKKATKKKAVKSPFGAKFVGEMKARLIEERAKYLHSAEEYRAEADALLEGREPGDVQFDEESGEGDTLAVERERDLALSAQARTAVAEIDAALERIEKGVYGVCITSGLAIPQERLRAIPWAGQRVEYKVGGLGRM